LISERTVIRSVNSLLAAGLRYHALAIDSDHRIGTESKHLSFGSPETALAVNSGIIEGIGIRPGVNTPTRSNDPTESMGSFFDAVNMSGSRYSRLRSRHRNAKQHRARADS